MALHGHHPGSPHFPTRSSSVVPPATFCVAPKHTVHHMVFLFVPPPSPAFLHVRKTLCFAGGQMAVIFRASVQQRQASYGRKPRDGGSHDLLFGCHIKVREFEHTSSTTLSLFGTSFRCVSPSPVCSLSSASRPRSRSTRTSARSSP